MVAPSLDVESDLRARTDVSRILGPRVAAGPSLDPLTVGAQSLVQGVGASDPVSDHYLHEFRSGSHGLSFWCSMVVCRPRTAFRVSDASVSLRAVRRGGGRSLRSCACSWIAGP